MGKTTLFSMMPNAIFIGLDDGGRRTLNPQTGTPVNHIPDIETYDDVRMALHQTNLFPKGSSCIIDTVTLLEQQIEAWVIANVPLPKGGKATNIKAYGWNEGSSHMLDAFRLILQDLDALVRRGVNIGLIGQEQVISIANPEGLVFMQACPKLHHDKSISLMLEACAWADQVFRIGYPNLMARDGKVAGDTKRAIYTKAELHFFVKQKGLDDAPVIKFDSPDDTNLWEFVYPDKFGGSE